MCRAQSLLVLALFVGLAQSWDIAVSTDNRLEFYTPGGVKTDTVHFNSQILTSLAYDEVNNVMLYVNKQSGNDTICGYNINSAEYKCYLERNGRNIQGLVFDPITEQMFFTDTKEKSINWFSFKPGFNNSVFGNLLMKFNDGIPVDLAVDSCRGYLYWINRTPWLSTIEKMRFDGSARQVVINHNEPSLTGLAICLQRKKIYYAVTKPMPFRGHIYATNFDGTNRQIIIDLSSKNGYYEPYNHPNVLSSSKDHLYNMGSCLSCSPRHLWKFVKPIQLYKIQEVFGFYSQSLVGTATNYKVVDQFRGISGCNQPNNYAKPETNNGLKVAREPEGPFCDHGIKVSGESFCKCTPGYTGARCDVSVCGNYCLKGDCSINEEGLPKCRCNAGYSGERCEVNVCQGHCSNNGTCSFNAESQPVCQCKGNYLGDRCELSACENYCLQGNCSINEEGDPVCRCNAGYSGEKCEVNVCQGHCSNNGICSLNEESQPVCQCKANYLGDRCELSACENYCLQGNCSINEEGHPECRCNAGYSGERCEVNLCQGHCSNNGICSLNEESQPVCQCKGNYLGDRCELSACENYCLQGNCSINEGGHPACRCNAGYSGERCEVNVCQAGHCSLNEKSQPVCQCKGNDLGDRCELSACENYCLQGKCSINEEGHPACRCNAGYSGQRCEVDDCHGYCLNNGICSLNEEDEAFCECVGDYEGDRCDVPVRLNDVDGCPEADQKNSNTINFLEENVGNLSLNDLLANWRKHAH